MIRNQADQTVSFSMISATDGSDVTTGTPSIFVRVGNGAWAAGGGTAPSYSGKGAAWDYTPTAAETNASTCAYMLTIAGAITQVVNVDTEDAEISSRLAPLQAGRALSITNTNLANANVAQWRETQPNTLDGTNVRASVAATTTAGDQALQNAINGGEYPLSTDVSGQIRIVNGTGPGEIKVTNGVVACDVEQWQAVSLSGGLAMVEDDGSGNWRWTAKALEQGPSGGGGASPWTEADVEGMRYRCQLDGKQTQPLVDAPDQFTVTADGLAATATQVDDLHTWNGPQDIPGKVAAPTNLNAGDAARWAYKLLIAERRQTAIQETVLNPVDNSVEHQRDKSDDGVTAIIGKLEVAP